MVRNKKFRRVTGIVLGAKEVGEADKLVVLFSPELGKFNVIAYGSNRLKSRFSNKINMSNVVRCWVRFPQEINKIPSLEETEVLANFFDLVKEEPLKVFSINFAVEVINLFVPLEVFDAELNNLAIKFFEDLVTSKNDDETFYVLSKFLVNFLRVQGILPYVKNEKDLNYSTKLFVISILKNREYTQVDTKTKLDFLDWFSRKVEKTIAPRKLISIELIREVLI
ncbi:MAG: DNA repair protein RecO [Brevinematia bacterium]